MAAGSAGEREGALGATFFSKQSQHGAELRFVQDERVRVNWN